MSKKYGLLGLAVILGAGFVALGLFNSPAMQINAQEKGEICDNGLDDDGDKLADCLDPDCDCDTTSPCFEVNLDPPKNDKHVSLCHFTGGTNIVLNEPSVSAWETHVGHHGDCWRFYSGAVGCAE